jgi:hypothetical protein
MGGDDVHRQSGRGFSPIEKILKEPRINVGLFIFTQFVTQGSITVAIESPSTS